MNNNDIITKLQELKDTELTALSPSERGSMRASIQEVIEMPVISGGVNRHIQGTPSPFPYGISFFKKPMTVSLVALSAVFLLSGGVAAAAEGSLPGELLYPLKIHVTEEVQAYLATSDEEKVLWEVARAERRIDEANTLIATGKASPAILATVEQKLDHQVTKTLRKLSRLTEKGDVVIATDVGTKFEARLTERVAALRALSNVDGDVSGVDALTNSITEKARVVHEGRTEHEASIETDDGLEELALRRKMDAAAQLAKLEDSLEGATELNADARITLEAKLSVTKELFDDASALLVAGAYADAATSFEEAGRLAHMATVSIGSLLHPLPLDIKVVE